MNKKINEDREVFAQKVGLNVDDPLIDEAFSKLSLKGLNRITNLECLNKYLDRYNELKSRKEDKILFNY